VTKKLASQRNVLIAIVAFFVAVAAGGWFVLISPQQSHAGQLGAKVAAVQSQIDDRQTAIDAAGHGDEIQTANLYKLTKAMPDQIDMPDILLELSQIAHDTGIEFQSITPTATAPLGGYQVVPIGLVFQGNFYDLADFIYRLRNLVTVHDGNLSATGRLFSIDTLDFSEGDNKFPQIAATLTVDAYVYGVPATASAGVPTTGAPTGTTDTTGTTTSPTSTDSTTTPASPSVPPATASAAGVTN
jgi:Tfp pilus assembly protein PilO